jgi:hypothetical protein
MGEVKRRGSAIVTISAQGRRQGLLGLSTSTRIAGTIIGSKEAGVLHWTEFVLGFLAGQLQEFFRSSLYS